MPLPTLDLDDRSFDDLVEEARALVPAHAPAWTNHNASDPGITLLELFAWLAEMLLYRANQVPASHRVVFLRLLNGPEWMPGPDLDADVERTLRELRTRWRAVTCEDYEELAREVSPNVARVRCVPRRNLRTGRDVDTPGSVTVLVVSGVRPSVVLYANRRYRDVTNLARSEYGASFGLPNATDERLYVGSAEPLHGVQFSLEPKGAGYDLVFEYWDGGEWVALADDAVEDGTASWTADGVVSFAPPEAWETTTVAGAERYWLRISTTRAPTRAAQALQVSADDRLLRRIDERLDERRILGTTHHVLEPEYVPVAADMLVVRRADVPEAAVRAAAIAAVDAFLDPLSGGPDGGGWPFGRPVFVSELHELLRALPEVDHVADLRLLPAPSSRWVRAAELWHRNGEQIGLDVGAHRLPESDLDPAAIRVVDEFLPVRVRVDVELSETASQGDAARAVKEAVRAFFHPAVARPSGYQPLKPAVLAPGALREPVETRLGALGSVRAIALESDPDRMERDEVLDVVTVRVDDGELVEPTTVVRFAE